ncbi:MAG: DUF4139 domain-containing protein [Sandaracinaceae bacterium]|nr:DUF4139 domain-containing protein [Sandaracinaceae bacterium]
MARSTCVLALLAALGCGGAARPVRLARVVLYQSGVGYFEHRGEAEGSVRLLLASHEVDDVLTTLTVVDPEHPERSAAPSAVVPRERGAEGTAQPVAVDLGEGRRALSLAYAAPAAAWRASYRLVLPDERGGEEAWLQAWAVVDNTSAEDWRDVELTLATDAPLSFAVDLRTPRLVPRPNVTGYAAPPIALGAHPIGADHPRRRRGPDPPTRWTAARTSRRTSTASRTRTAAPTRITTPTASPTSTIAARTSRSSSTARTTTTAAPITAASWCRTPRCASSIRSTSPTDRSSRPLPAGRCSTPSRRRSGRTPTCASRCRGHADEREEDPWRTSAGRAAAVRAALVARGVDPSRLAMQAYGATQPIAPPPSERNRRAHLRIEDREEAPASGAVRREAMERSASAAFLPRRESGGTRFTVGRAVTVPAGSSAMVTILERGVSGEDVLLYRVDAAAPGSDVHPFRAARLANRSGIDLVPGPISLFARGELVGQGLLDALREGENAFVPYALDRSSHVTVEVEESVAAGRVLGLSRGVLTVERVAVRRTRYRVEAGARVPARIFVRHARAAGYAHGELPPGSESSPTALLVPIPVEPRRDAALTLEERRPIRATIELRADLGTDLRPFLDASELEPAVLAALRQLADDREALARTEERAAALRTRLAENAERAEELRRSIAALDERGGASSAAVRRRMTERLDAATREGETIAAELATLRVEQIDARARLREAASRLVME